MKIEKSQVNFSARRLLVEYVNFSSSLALDYNVTINAKKPSYKRAREYKGRPLADRAPTTLPRGSGKTTLCEIACVCAALYGFHKFILIVGSEAGVALARNWRGADEVAALPQACP